MRNSIFLLFFIGIFLTSCDENRVFDQYQSVENSWDAKKPVVFTLPKLPADKFYNMFINLRANKDYPFNNIFLIVAMEMPNKKVLVDTLEYQMANPDGTMMGTGFSDFKESKLFYKQKFQFKYKGQYKINIKHALRKTGNTQGVDKLVGVSDVGFRIENIQ